jgi:hypothetical protein
MLVSDEPVLQTCFRERPLAIRYTHKDNKGALMTYICIEAKTAAQMVDFKKTPAYAEYIKGATEVTEGINPHGDYDDDEQPMEIHWTLIENEELEDHRTLRINDNGEAEFWASGVEI